MKNVKKLLLTFIFVVLFSCLFSISAFANSPPIHDYFNLSVSNAPENAMYADLLIKIDETDPKYVEFQENDDYGDDKEVISEILNYSEDGYRSYTLHYANAGSDIELYDEGDYLYAEFCIGEDYENFKTQYEDLRENYSTIKIVLLDENYKIIDVSNEREVPQDSDITFFTGYIGYDVSENILDINRYTSPYHIVFGGFFAIIIILVSVLSELIVAVLFKIKGSRLFGVVIINFCSQFLMRMLYIVLPFTYVIETIILEILVYSAEFVIYKKCFDEMKTAKLLAFTVTANTVSLIAGLLLNEVLLLVK